MSTGGPLLAVHELCLERGGRELFQQLSFAILPGQLVQIEGANGAGKTSLLRILAGLSRYGFTGRVERHTPLLYLGHQPAVKALLTPRENLAWHVAGEARYNNEQIERALASVGLYGYEDVPSNTLSAGQHRRVNLARLYLSRCPLWLLDEPTVGLDDNSTGNLRAAMQDQLDRGGLIIATTHVDLGMRKARTFDFANLEAMH